MSATMKAAVHLGQDYQVDLRTTKNTDFEKVKHLFDNSQKLILTQKNEIYGVICNRIEYNSMDEHDFAKRPSGQAVKNKGTCFL